MTDTNVWLDLDAGDLLDACFVFGVRWMSTDLVLAEQPMVRIRARLRALGLIVRTLDLDELEEVTALAERHPGPSVEDLSCLVAARRDEALLLSGDRALRMAAVAEGVAVHGTLWLLDEAVQSGWMTPRHAIATLRKMRSATPPRRLPAPDCERLLE